MANIIIVCLFILSFATLYVPGLSNFERGNIHFYILLSLIVLDIYKNRRISLFTIWIIAFIYIVLSDILLFNYSSSYDTAVTFLLIANDVYLIGYLCNRKKFKKKEIPVYICSDYTIFRDIIIIIYLLVLLFLVGNFYVPTLKILFNSSVFLSGFISSAALLISMLVGFFIVRVKQKPPILALIITLPIIYFLIIDGTRFRLLYASLPFFVLIGFFPICKLHLRNIVLIGVLGIAAIFLSTYIKHNRRGRGSGNIENVEFYDINNHPYKNYISVRAAKYCSTETIVEMTYLANRYFSIHPLKYGVQTAMIFYFWVPRDIWPDKPTMIDYWLPKLYMRGISENFSSASGFAGELRADFGYFSLFFLFLFGFLMKKADNFLQNINYTQRSNYYVHYVVLLIPFFFFAVRSPLTSFYSLIAQIMILYLIQLVCFKRIDTKSSQNINGHSSTD